MSTLLFKESGKGSMDPLDSDRGVGPGIANISYNTCYGIMVTKNQLVELPRVLS